MSSVSFNLKCQNVNQYCGKDPQHFSESSQAPRVHKNHFTTFGCCDDFIHVKNHSTYIEEHQVVNEQISHDPTFWQDPKTKYQRIHYDGNRTFSRLPTCSYSFLFFCVFCFVFSICKKKIYIGLYILLW